MNAIYVVSNAGVQGIWRFTTVFTLAKDPILVDTTNASRSSKPKATGQGMSEPVSGENVGDIS